MSSSEFMARLLTTIQHPEPVDEEGRMPEGPWEQMEVSQDVDAGFVSSKCPQALCKPSNCLHCPFCLTI